VARQLSDGGDDHDDHDGYDAAEEVSREEAVRRARAALGDSPEVETSQEAIVHIAQDAMLVLRRELAFRAELARILPGTVSMTDSIALLRLATDLGAQVKQGEEAGVQQADYSRLTPQERVQLAALLLKVDYS
jgi:hypothetical protein